MKTKTLLLFLLMLWVHAGHVFEEVWGRFYNIATLLTGRYFHGFAGGFTGIAMLLLAWPLVRSLRKEMPEDSSLGRDRRAP